MQMQLNSASKPQNSNDVSGSGGLDGEERIGAEGMMRRSSHLSKSMAVDVATKAAGRPPQATSVTGEVGELNQMNGSRPDPYVILNLGSFIRRVPFQRATVWIAVSLVMYQLRDFVGVGFLLKLEPFSYLLDYLIFFHIIYLHGIKTSRNN
jgi:hypothetical protein